MRYFVPVQAPKTVIIIAGPTAVGKTSAGIALARYFDTEIISADSRQCFKELNIGVARPSAEELEAVPHHFIATQSIHQKVTAATFESYALQKAAELFQTKSKVVVVGGTGLYIKAFCEGMDEIPEVPQAIHEEVINQYEKQGSQWLQAEVMSHDKMFWEQGENQNPQRLMRALEVKRATGKSILEFRKGIKKERPFRIIKIGLNRSKETLHANINYRVDKMMKEGLLNEAAALLPYQHLNALQTVGYKELFDFFEKKTTLACAVEAIKTHTRQYAKRQLTWFRKDTAYTWLAPDAAELIDVIKRKTA